MLNIFVFILCVGFTVLISVCLSLRSHLFSILPPFSSLCSGGLYCCRGRQKSDLCALWVSLWLGFICSCAYVCLCMCPVCLQCFLYSAWLSNLFWFCLVSRTQSQLPFKGQIWAKWAELSYRGNWLNKAPCPYLTQNLIVFAGLQKFSIWKSHVTHSVLST